MLRTPPSSRKRARLLEGSVSEDRAILPLPDDLEPQALAAYRHRSALKDQELLAKLQLENAKLSQSLQTAEASSREFEVQLTAYCLLRNLTAFDCCRSSSNSSAR